MHQLLGYQFSQASIVLTPICHGILDRGVIHFENTVRSLLEILPQSSGDFDPEADPELKKPPDSSEFLIRRNFRKLCILIRTKIM